MPRRRTNIVDELCARLKLDGPGRLTKLAHRFEVSRQVINGWRVRNKLPESQYAKASDLSGIPIEDFLGWRSSGLTVTMSEFVADVPRFLQVARDGSTITVTVNGDPVVRVAPPQ